MTRRFFYFAAILTLFFSLAPQCLAVCDDSWYECINKQTGESHDNTCSDDLWIFTKYCCEHDSQGQCSGCCSRKRLAKECFDWEQCSSGAAACQCCGECFGTPQGPRYYDDPTISDQPSKSRNPQSIDLPLKLDWDDVMGWKDGWVQNGSQQSCSRNCAKSYRLTIYDTTAHKEIVNKVLTKSEYNIRENHGACFLKPGQTYEWHVQACCDSNGTSCGPSSNWSFKTSLAPELKTPYDPDWAGPEKIENTNLPVVLDWCSGDKYNSYDLFAYIVKDGVDSCHPKMISLKGCDSYAINDFTIVKKDIFFEDSERRFFTKKTEYKWQIGACEGNLNTGCSSPGQKWGFTTEDENLTSTEESIPPDDPQEKKPIGLPISFDWLNVQGANSYIFQLNNEFSTTIGSSNLLLDDPIIKINTSYDWSIKPCWDFEGKQCEKDFGRNYHFKTTGLPVANINIDTSGYPVKIKWNGVGGANSYYYQLSSDSGFGSIVQQGVVSQDEISFNYPDIKQGENYWFQLKTCAHQNGELCGNWSSPQSFQPLIIKIASGIQPQNNANVLKNEQNYMSWDKIPGAQYYQYKIKYSSVANDETKKECPSLLNQSESKITANNSGMINYDCKGIYEWQVHGCLDKNCDDNSSGEWTAATFFNLTSQKLSDENGTVGGWGGIVPCGLRSDNLKTTNWDETDRCQLKHLVLMAGIIIDFLLGKLIPIVLVLLILSTGLLFYFYPDKGALFPKVKAMWKAAGIGFLIILFSWTIVNIGISLVGFDFGVFGKWWQFKF